MSIKPSETSHGFSANIKVNDKTLDYFYYIEDILGKYLQEQTDITNKQPKKKRELLFAGHPAFCVKDFHKEMLEAILKVDPSYKGGVEKGRLKTF